MGKCIFSFPQRQPAAIPPDTQGVRLKNYRDGQARQVLSNSPLPCTHSWPRLPQGCAPHWGKWLWPSAPLLGFQVKQINLVKKKKKLISCTLISIKLLFCLSCYREQWRWDSWLGRQSLSLLAQWLRSLHTKSPRNQISQTSTVNTKKGPLASTCCISRWKYKTWTGQKVFLSKVQFLPPFRSRTLRHGRFYFISSFIIYAVAIA